MDENTKAALVTVSVLVCAFLPVIIAEFPSRKLLVAASVLLCLAAAGLTVSGAVFGFAGAVFGFAAGAALWFMALLIGLAASLDAMAERRMNELCHRLLTGDARQLDVPRYLRRPKSGQNEQGLLK